MSMTRAIASFSHALWTLFAVYVLVLSSGCHPLPGLLQPLFVMAVPDYTQTNRPNYGLNDPNGADAQREAAREEANKQYESASGAYEFLTRKDEDEKKKRASLTISMRFKSNLEFIVGTVDFGHSIDHHRYMYYKGVIAKPPPDTSQLCTLPEELMATYRNDLENIPVALLVELETGGCDVLTKASNALRIQKDVTSNLKYVLFYNNDRYDPSSIVTLSLDDTSRSTSARELAPLTKSPTLAPSLSSYPSSAPSTSSSNIPAPTSTVAPTNDPAPTLAPSTSAPTPLLAPTLSSYPSSASSTSSSNITDPTATPASTSDPAPTVAPSTSAPTSFEPTKYAPTTDAPTETWSPSILPTIWGITDDDFDRNQETIIDVGSDTNNDNVDAALEEDLAEQLTIERERMKTELEGNDSIVFASLPFAVGRLILANIEEQVLRGTYNVGDTIASAEFLEPGFEKWRMDMRLQIIEPSSPVLGSPNDDDVGNDDYLTNKNSGGSNSYSDRAPSTFNVLKYVLFGLLIISPCLRAFHLWWAGGGRIRFRHSEDESNRIVGLQYIPPMDNWFGPYEPVEGERVHGRLTTEQIMALPEIIYQKPNFDHEDDDATEAPTEATDPNHIYHESDDRSETGAEAPDEATGAARSNDPDGDTVRAPSDTIPCPEPERFALPGSPERVGTETGSLSSSSSSSASSSLPSGPREDLPPDEEQPAAEAAPLSFRTQRRLRAFTTTTCTTCSICIDEFEVGEKIRLLPLCGHGFHTECILPWLRERQGCCPLCKMEVIEEAGANNRNNSNSNSNNGTDGGNAGT